MILILEILWRILPALFMAFIGIMFVDIYFNVREIKEDMDMEVDEINRAQRRAQTRQNKQQPRVGNVNLQTVTRQLNNSLRELARAGVKIKDWDDPDKTLWGFQIKHGRIHYLSVKENKDDGERVSEPSETTQPENQTEP